MTGKSLINIASDVAADVVSVLGIPSSALRSLLGSFVQIRMDAAFNILIEELGAGRIDELHAANEDEAVAVIYRYSLAASDGAARRNLRLLSRAICGRVRRDRLYADDFNKYADILSRLTSDQILVLGQYVYYARQQDMNADSETSRNAAMQDLLGSLVPEHFDSREHVISILNQSAALGLIVPGSAWGGMVYNISPVLIEITELVGDLSDMLSQDKY